MIDSTIPVTVPTPDGPMEVHLATPEQTSPGESTAGVRTEKRRHAVVVVQEAFGVNAHIKDVASRLAADGFIAAAPELFHRAGKDVHFGYDEREKMFPVFSSLDNATIETDLKATIAWLRSRSDVDPAKIGVLGFCMGGFAAFLAACRTDAAAFVAFYPGGVVNERPNLKLQPLLEEAPQILRPILLFFGKEDSSIPASDVDQIRDKLRALGKVHQIVSYDGAGHGFFCDARDAFRPEAAADAWEHTREFLREKL